MATPPGRPLIGSTGSVARTPKSPSPGLAVRRDSLADIPRFTRRSVESGTPGLFMRVPDCFELFPGGIVACLGQSPVL
jgi:hypothetical protein